MYFVDKCHKAGIGIIIDWASAHFAKESMDYADLKEQVCMSMKIQDKENTKIGERIFNFGRTEVHNFLISNALY